MGSRALRRLFPVVPFVVVVVAVELAAFGYRTVYCPGDPPSFAVPDTRYGWSHPPGARVHAYNCAGRSYEWKQTLSFNSHGLHDDETAYERTPGVARVLVLGDSVAEGQQVGSANFTRKLEEMFAADGRTVEVVNAGHAGFGTDNEALFYETEGRRYDADVVVLEFNLQNDIAENSPVTLRRMYEGGPVHPKAGVSLRADGGIDLDTTEYERAAAEWAGDPWRSSRALRWLRTHSFFVRHFSNVLRGRRERQAYPPEYPRELDVYAVPVGADWSEARTITEALLRRLRADVERDGKRLLVVVVPSKETVEPAGWANLVTWFPKLGERTWDLEMPRRWLTGFLADEGMDFVDTTDAIRERRRATNRAGYFAFDPHPDADGHAWIAEAIHAALASKLPETAR